MNKERMKTIIDDMLQDFEEISSPIGTEREAYIQFMDMLAIEAR